jgi:hypothetical protein
MAQDGDDRLLAFPFGGPPELIEAVFPDEDPGPPGAITAEIDPLADPLDRALGKLKIEAAAKKVDNPFP